jgi:serine/threonine-protein kinase HipA
MPVRARRYDTQILMPPFQIGLPEGALLEHLRSRFGKVMDINNDMVLLKLVGNHTLGRVRFTEPNQILGTETASDYSLRDLLSYPETEDGIKKVRRQVKWFGSKQKVHRALCERMANIMAGQVA